MLEVSVEWQNLNLYKFSAALSIVSLAENAVLHPFWLLKTRLQNQTEAPAKKSAFHNLNVARSIVKTKGIRGLYPGFGVSAIGGLPSACAYFISYHWCKHALADTSNPILKPAAPLVAGVAADVISVALYVPVDVVIQRLALANSPFKNSLEVSKHIWKTEGFAGFYRGMGITTLTYGLSSGSWWMTYEYSKQFLGGTEKAGVTGQAASGFLAGISSAIVTNPLDVIKTRIQSHPGQVDGHHFGEQYKNTWHGLKSIVGKEGVSALGKGLSTRMISRGPLSAVSSLLYELVMYVGRKDPTKAQ